MDENAKLKELEKRFGSFLLNELFSIFKNTEEIEVKLKCIDLMKEVGINIDQLNSI